MSISEERYLGYLISDAARLQRTVFDRRVRKLGFTRSQWLVLGRLGRQPGVSQSELAELLEVEKATAGRLIDRLEKNGWIERRTDEADRRIKRIYMTERGKKAHDTIGPIAEAMLEEELLSLTEAERKLLTDLMINVKRQLQQMLQKNTHAAAPVLGVEND